MATTLYVSGTVVASAWLNDVDDVVYKPAKNLTGSVARSALSKFADIVSIKDFGAVGDGTADDTAAFTLAFAAITYGQIYLPTGTYKVTSQIVVPKRVRLLGNGVSDTNGTGATNRGATCILRGFTGALATVSLTGDDSGIDQIDIDNNNQGTGDCLQVWGTRAQIGRISTRNSGGNGVRIGKTDAGAATINANCWHAVDILTCGNAAAGMRVDDTNTTTSLTYPLGVANVNGGSCLNLDARTNGTDGLQLGNANDCVFTMVTSQFNTGCGIRFKTDGTNAGPRCNKILGNDCENNTGNDIQIDAATLPVSGPGLYNVILGNRSVAVTSRIVDSSTGSYVQQWRNDLTLLERAYHSGETVNVVNVAAAGVAKVMLYADTLTSNVGQLRGKQTGTTGGQVSIQTKRDASTPADAITWDNLQNTIINGLLATAAAAPTIASSNTIAPTKPITFISGVTVLKTITAPSPISAGGGQITLIPTGLWSTDLTGNIALATTAVVNKALIMTYDTTTGKWYPSY